MSFRLLEWGILPAGAAIRAEAEELDVVFPDEEPVFPGQDVFCLPDQVELLFLEIPVIQDLAAARADQMMMMVGILASSVFETNLTVPRVDLPDKAGPIQEVECPINRREADGRVGRIEGGINLFGAEVLLRLDKEVENLLAGYGPALTMVLDLIAMWGTLSVLHGPSK